MTITSNPAMYGGHLMQQPQSTYVHAFGNAPPQPHPHHAHMMSVPQPIHPGGTSAGISGGDMYSRPHYQSNPLLNHSPLGASSLEASASSSSLTGGFSSNNSCSVFYDLTSPLTPHNNQTRPSVNYGHQHEGMCRVNSSSSTTSPHSINNNAQQTTFNFVQSSSPDAEFMEYEEQQHPTFGNDTENQYSEIIALSSNPNLVQPQQQQHGGSLVLGKEELTFSHLQTSPSTQQQNHSMCPSNHSYVSQNQHAPHMNTSYNQFSSSSTCSTKPMQSSALPLSVSNQNNSLNEQLDIDNTIMLQSPRTNLRLGIPVRYAEPLFWCQIRYYEFSQQVGEVCYVSPSQFAVDGGTDPSSAERFCLGSLSNVNRQEIVEITRNNIGKGLQLFRTRNHEIHAKCLGDSPLFVQSQCCNLRYNWDPGTVCKIPPDFNLKVFTMEEFQDHLKAQLRTNQSYKSIMDLTSLCSIRISFIKGWGQEYTRKRITDVPCWIEILLNGPSQWLDRVLQRINPSSEPCDSR